MQHTTVPIPVPARSPLSVMPWTLRAWPPLLWQATEVTPTGFRHLSTHVVPADSLTGCRPSGQTIWAGMVLGAQAGMAWDWVEIAEGVVAMADPLAVVTNLRIIGDEGEPLNVAQSARFLTSLVRALPWQDEVGRALASTCH